MSLWIARLAALCGSEHERRGAARLTFGQNGSCFDEQPLRADEGAAFRGSARGGRCLSLVRIGG